MDVFFDESAVPVDQLNASRELFELLQSFSGVTDDTMDRVLTTATFLPAGKAIPPLDAARCVLDYRRTIVFASGVHAAVSDLIERFPESKIEIVYAGCGPFATLALPILERFTPEKIKLTLIDIHEFSLEAAAKCIAGLGLSAHDVDYVLTDASTYQHPRDVHLVISETMQVRLITEMQTPITLNLAPQLIEGGIFVPEVIEVEAALAYKQSQFELPEFESLTSLALLSAEVIRRGEHRPFGGVVRLGKSSATDEQASVAMRTKITVYRNHVLSDNESGLTMYKLLPNEEVRSAESIEFVFLAGEKPRWQINYR